MKRGQQPRLFPHVLQAIVSLKEAGGSSSGRIINLVQNSLNKSSPAPRNITMQVRRAIRHGIETGLIKHRSGRYSANLKIFDPLNFCQAKRGGKRSKRPARKNRRRRNVDPFEEDYASGAESVESYSGTATDVSRSRTESPEPSECQKKKHKKKKCKRRRRSICPSLDEPDEMSSSKDHHGHPKEKTTPECDNPGCLCNLKQEPVDATRKPADNFPGEYIN